jgi:hydrogenase expression/formation protein HypD
MKYIDEYRDKKLIAKLAAQIRKAAVDNYTFMEVCGGHTAAIHRFGIPSLLPGNIKLISGPGCPVCVTGTDFIDKAIAYSQREDVIIATFGDLVRVPGSNSSLEKMMAAGSDIRIVLSALDALDIARDNPLKKVIFPGIGFETTSPGTAVTIKQAVKEKVFNFSILCGHKLMPPAMEAIIREGVRFDGFICPGHVAAITGSVIFDFIPQKHNLGCVVTGFEPVDLLQSVLMLVLQVNRQAPKVEIQYNRVVTKTGNVIAQKALSDVFETCDAHWRGLGMIPSSGLTPGRDFRRFNIEDSLPLDIKVPQENEHCICGDILRGLKTPDDCPLFGGLCVPENPVGACMVSVEGSCHTWYKYKLPNG